ncbi:MAG: hypothetical protein JSW58_07980 [Candidatus Latescibacterota bacterium]|nr:MAG: hypothetical protein JSW58_07980 [Candidatus Latescibacterota bacterium]
MISNPNQILSAFADNIVEYVLETVGERDVLSIFIAGSVAQDDIAFYDDSGMLEIYSDLDLFVVISERLDLESCRRRIKDYAASLPREFENCKIYAGPDVGVYSEKDLYSQQTRPGTVDISVSHRVIFGSEEIPKRTRRFVASAIDPSESLYLLENRLSEIAELTDRLGNEGSGGFDRYVHYALLKACFDLVAAVLIVVGEYAESRDERMRRFRTPIIQGRAGDLLPPGSIEVIGSSHSSLLNLQERVSIEREELGTRLGVVESLLLRSWKRIYERDDLERPAAWHDVIERRCKRGKWSENLRELLVLGKRMSIPRPALVLRSARVARLSPIESLRLAGLVDILLRHDGDDVPNDVRVAGVQRGRLETGYLRVIDGLTRAFGLCDGSTLKRGRSLFKKTT